MYPAGELLTKVLEKAERIAANSHLLTSMAKEAVGKGIDVTSLYELVVHPGIEFSQAG